MPARAPITDTGGRHATDRAAALWPGDPGRGVIVSIDLAADRIRQSSRLFRDHVWGQMIGWAGHGQLVMVEDDANPIARHLDVTAGIDAYQVWEDRYQMRGIASRVQYDRHLRGRRYRTWTSRLQTRAGNRTEFTKRLEAVKQLDQGYLYPHLTVQSYFDECATPGCRYGCQARPALLRFAAIKTTDLYPILDAGYRGGWYRPIPGDDGSLFLACPWDDARDLGVTSYVWDRT